MSGSYWQDTFNPIRGGHARLPQCARAEAKVKVLDPFLAGMHALAEVLRKQDAPREWYYVKLDIIKLLGKKRAKSVPWEEVLRRAVIECVLTVTPDWMCVAGPDIDDVPRWTVVS